MIWESARLVRVKKALRVNDPFNLLILLLIKHDARFALTHSIESGSVLRLFLNGSGSRGLL